MEVIAKKSKTVFFIYLFMLILGVLLLPFGIYGLIFVEGSHDISTDALLVSIPLALIALGASSMAKYLKLSFTFTLIRLCNDTLIIGKNKYIIKVSDLQKVEAEKEMGTTGKLTLFTQDNKIQLFSVAQYKVAHARLLELINPKEELSKSQN